MNSLWIRQGKTHSPTRHEGEAQSTEGETTMVMRSDPFREFDRLSQQVFGTRARPAAMPMDAYRKDDTFYIELDLPGIALDSIDLTVDQNVLTIRAERTPTGGDDLELLVAERPAGTFSRQVFRHSST